MTEGDEGSGLPAFVGKPLRDVPVPAAELWHEDKFGEAVLDEYNERVRLDFDENPFLKIFKVAAGIIHGSNPFAVCLVDMIVRPQVRVATLADLQAILDARDKTSRPIKMRGGYKDAALALRTVSEPNVYLGDRLKEQLPPHVHWPVVISLSGLELVKDPASPCGLAFELTPRTQAHHAPILDASSGHFSDSLVDRATGLPKAIEGTGRYFYSMNKGLARLYLGRGSSIDTIWEELGSSQVDGRVVFVNNAITSERLSEYIRRLDDAVKLVTD
ncbi:MAG: hypothetical protein ACYTFZ_02910 [Planctomycetota bacterium]